jgi:hypothetical protein
MKATLTLEDDGLAGVKLTTNFHGEATPNSPAHRAAILLMEHMNTLGAPMEDQEPFKLEAPKLRLVGVN